jgi:hypothetical protein
MADIMFSIAQYKDGLFLDFLHDEKYLHIKNKLLRQNTLLFYNGPSFKTEVVLETLREESTLAELAGSPPKISVCVHAQSIRLRRQFQTHC